MIRISNDVGWRLVRLFTAWGRTYRFIDNPTNGEQIEVQPFVKDLTDQLEAPATGQTSLIDLVERYLSTPYGRSGFTARNFADLRNALMSPSEVIKVHAKGAKMGCAACGRAFASDVGATFHAGEFYCWPCRFPSYMHNTVHIEAMKRHIEGHHPNIVTVPVKALDMISRHMQGCKKCQDQLTKQEAGAPDAPGEDIYNQPPRVQHGRAARPLAQDPMHVGHGLEEAPATRPAPRFWEPARARGRGQTVAGATGRITPEPQRVVPTVDGDLQAWLTGDVLVTADNPAFITTTVAAAPDVPTPPPANPTPTPDTVAEARARDRNELRQAFLRQITRATRPPDGGILGGGGGGL